VKQVTTANHLHHQMRGVRYLFIGKHEIFMISL
jgi:hypothetical protein